MPLNVGRWLGRITFGKGAQLGRRHGQRAGLFQKVLQPHHRHAPRCARSLIQGNRVIHLIDGADLQMVLQVLANTIQGVFYGNVVSL